MGHLVCAQEARWQLGLDRVLLVPCGNPPHRRIESDPGSEHRFEMCLLAASDGGWLELSRIELDREEVGYTYETLVRLSETGDDLVLIVGGDQAATFPEWHRPEDILGLATLAVAEREGFKREQISARLNLLKGAGRVVFFDMPRVGVSSSMIRQRVSEGRPINHLAPDSVVTYIDKNGLYRG